MAGKRTGSVQGGIVNHVVKRATGNRRTLTWAFWVLGGSLVIAGCGFCVIESDSGPAGGCGRLALIMCVKHMHGSEEDLGRALVGLRSSGVHSLQELCNAAGRIDGIQPLIVGSGRRQEALQSISADRMLIAAIPVVGKMYRHAIVLYRDEAGGAIKLFDPSTSSSSGTASGALAFDYWDGAGLLIRRSKQ